MRKEHIVLLLMFLGNTIARVVVLKLHCQNYHEGLLKHRLFYFMPRASDSVGAVIPVRRICI